MKIKRKAITLLEIMIVIFIIGIIGSVIGYNMKGSMDEGRSYRSEHGSKQVHDLLMLKIAESDSIEEVLSDAVNVLKDSGFVSNPKKLLKDGWNKEFEIRRLNEEDFVVYSPKWHAFLQSKKKMTDERLAEEFPWAFNFDE